MSRGLARTLFLALILAGLPVIAVGFAAAMIFFLLSFGFDAASRVIGRIVEAS